MTDALAPPEVIAALSTLNAHARAYGCGKKAVYAYKLLVALMYAAADQSNARPVSIMSKCRNCDGTGKFISWYDGPTDEWCRTCSRTGHVLLKFTETTIEGYSWHHPWTSEGQSILRAALGGADICFVPATRSLLITKPGKAAEEMAFGSPGDWKPNLPGEKLIGERAAELFNLVEDWLLGLRYVSVDLRWRRESAQRDALTYCLDLGWIGEACHYCGTPTTLGGQGHYQKPFHWSVRCCEQHQSMPVTEWDKAVPERAITPAVRRWAERRGWQHAAVLDGGAATQVRSAS